MLVLHRVDTRVCLTARLLTTSNFFGSCSFTDERFGQRVGRGVLHQVRCVFERLLEQLVSPCLVDKIDALHCRSQRLSSLWTSEICASVAAVGQFGFVLCAEHKYTDT